MFSCNVIVTFMSFVNMSIFFQCKIYKFLCDNRRIMRFISFIPKHSPVTQEDIKIIEKFLSVHSRICVLTGAGISTESGIPDYRSELVGLYARKNHKPMQYNDFLNSAYSRQRYWARNYAGWSRFSKIQPNIIHHKVHYLENIGKVFKVITQNVDNLHTKAGSTNIIELHGTAYKVVCLNCKMKICRFSFQDILNDLNPNLYIQPINVHPDGDVDISEDQIRNFRFPSCSQCGGILKPDIIFFGDNVPRTRVEQVSRVIEDSDALLILGSSLTTFSAYRIILQAKESNKKIAIINIGKTRADKEADVKISTKCGDIMSRINTFS